MEGLKLIPLVVLVLAISGVIVGAAVIVLDSFGENVDVCYNASWTEATDGTHCVNATGTLHASQGQEDLNFSNEYYSIYKGKVAQSDLAEQFPTIGIISIMVVIISIIAGVFVYMKFFQ